ncbi:uncharacterized protein TRIADDRAFT_55901 [Trichoplax adhaerens]|uniref:Methionine aminopeptidase n=1 Tax=Trichoplax adhaerens TaxID=10228 RepID=B3RW65_TRIAD|nr:hypothetical protein TRIADDRAFT_55901 [Trichoplax adhaerens]EDV25612.1 hypothetical protein TRIADDRAFT_55901 [Trichoplax adhaerens]|eukprot:XP_002111645.1 hypothetical protein TRIADDRAFT_55901 [Trichoplax adhaerens]
MASQTIRICETTGCGKAAKMRCPSCIKLSISASYFCSQQCFKNYWPLHKLLHNMDKQNGNKNTFTEKWPGYSYTGKLRSFPLSSPRTLPDSIARPDYADEGIPIGEQKLRGNNTIKILSAADIEKARKSARLGREVLEEGFKASKPGVTTDEIDRVVHEACIERDCYPSPLNYYNFPKSCCTSVNEVICHGIPDKRELEEGDILNVDVTVYHDGFHGDLNETFFIGKVDEVSQKLVKTSYECLQEAIKAVKVGIRYREFGNIIQRYAQANGFSVVKTYCGHGIHRLFHTSPNVPHYANNKAIGIVRAGHCFTIEPMISEGTWRDKSWPDNWTAVTLDGKRSAQFEETLLVTDKGVEILTQRQTENGEPYFMTQLKQGL